VIILFVISLLSPLAAMLLGWKQRYTLLWFYPATGLFIDILSTLLKIGGLNHQWPANIFALSEFIFISLFYKKYIFEKNKSFRTLIFLIALLFSIQTIFRSVLDFNTFGYSLLCIIYIFYGLYGFYKIVKEARPISLTNSFFFWINAAVFLYATSVFILLLFRYFLQRNDPNLFNNLWTTFFFVINIQRYLLVGIGMNKSSKYES
jgi:hypothetical protein